MTGEHPLVTLSRVVREVGGEGLEIYQRPFGRGAGLRVWVPNDGVARLLAEADRIGVGSLPPVPHLSWGGSVDYDGSQIVFEVSVEMVRSGQAALHANELAAGTPALEERS